MHHVIRRRTVQALPAVAVLPKPNRLAVLLAATLAFLALVVAAPRPAMGTIQTTGIVYAYSGSPAVYGLPFFGNDVDYFPGIPPTIPSNAEFFEYNAVQGPALPGGGPATMDNEIVVGKGASGTLLISGASILRAEDLIIGDATEVNGSNRGGTGTVRVTGFGSTYNNDPGITALHPSVLGTSWTTIRAATDGYKMILGRGIGSTGLLDVSAGGVMEIQDAVILAPDQGSTGRITVDGFDSYFGSGGYNQGTANDLHIMVIGLVGTGIMEVRNGGTVVTEAHANPSASGIRVAASIGSEPFSDNNPPNINSPGAQGLVTITGPGSKWIVGGSLQIGSFHNVSGGLGQGRDFIGANVEYPTEAGPGILRIAEGGFVNIRDPINFPPSGTEDLLLTIGRFGRLELAGGWLTHGDIQTRNSRTAILNDGTISGSGRIDTGVFANRWLGEVRVGAGQKLLIAATADTTSTLPGAQVVEPMLNSGLIEVIGTIDNRAELEFERSPGTPTRPVRPLINRPVFLPPNPTLFIGGMMSFQHATLRSTSGIQNEGIMSFSAGSNIIKGLLTHVIGPTGFIPEFRIGPNTSVVVEDDCLGCFGALTFVGFGNTLQILDPGTFTGVGTFQTTLSLSNPNTINVAGDIAIGGLIKLSLASDVLANLAAVGPGASYEILSFSGGAYLPTLSDNGFWVPDYDSPEIPDCAGQPLSCTFPGLYVTPVNLSSLGPAFDNIIPIAQRIGQTVNITFVDAALVTPILVGDYNNDGKVDAADYVVWRKNEGTSNVLPNDPFGGTIGAQQYNAWRQNFGAMTMPGSGSGFGAAVPEPSSAMLMAFAGLLALARRAKRQA